jgi:hypothetical protein
MTVLVCFHDRCFDVVSSAAVFTRFYRQCVDAQAEFRYRGLMHRAGQLFDEGLFDAEENAIVDFKYSSSEYLTWWFDHHQSAFLTERPEREEILRAGLPLLHQIHRPHREHALRLPGAGLGGFGSLGGPDRRCAVSGYSYGRGDA